MELALDDHRTRRRCDDDEGATTRLFDTSPPRVNIARSPTYFDRAWLVAKHVDRASASASRGPHWIITAHREVVEILLNARAQPVFPERIERLHRRNEWVGVHDARPLHAHRAAEIFQRGLVAVGEGHPRVAI